MFLVVASMILTGVVIFLSFPFWWKPSSGTPMGLEASLDQERIDLEIEKQILLSSLSELDLDLAQGRLLLADYQRLKTIDENRLVRIFDKLDPLLKEGPRPPFLKPAPARQRSGMMKWAGSVVVSLLVAGSASILYSYINGKIGLEAQRVAMERQAQGPTGGQEMPNPLEMVARLEQRLRANPNDLEGQIMAGRSYMALQRLEEAQKAWSIVLEMDPGNHEAHYYLGLILLNTTRGDDPRIFEEALNHFETALVKVPREPAVLWNKGVALVHLKRFSEADESWTTAFQNLPPGSEDAEFVKKQLQSLRAGTLSQF